MEKVKKVKRSYLTRNGLSWKNVILPLLGKVIQMNQIGATMIY